MRATEAVSWTKSYPSTRDRVYRTISSGSSGHKVTVPEPLCSILFLMRRILAVEQQSASHGGVMFW